MKYRIMYHAKPLMDSKHVNFDCKIAKWILKYVITMHAIIKRMKLNYKLQC